MSRKTHAEPKGSATEKKVGTTVATTTPDRGARFDPFAQMHLGDWFDRWPEIFARRWPESFQNMPFAESGFRLEQFVDEDGTIVVRGELPGLDADKDVTVTVDGDRLTIAGNREERTEKKGDGTYRSEFHYGSFERSLRMPAGARTDGIEATYTNGILEVRVPCDADEPAVTKIPIRAAD